jgi:hypothetical protein
MIRERFLLTLPWQEPQIIDVRKWSSGNCRLSLLDRFNRFFWMNGEDVGFNVTVYRSSFSSPCVKLVIFGDYERALWTAWDGVVYEVQINKMEIAT